MSEAITPYAAARIAAGTPTWAGLEYLRRDGQLRYRDGAWHITTGQRRWVDRDGVLTFAGHTGAMPRITSNQVVLVQLSSVVNMLRALAVCWKSTPEAQHLVVSPARELPQWLVAQAAGHRFCFATLDNAAGYRLRWFASCEMRFAEQSIYTTAREVCHERFAA